MNFEDLFNNSADNANDDYYSYNYDESDDCVYDNVPPPCGVLSPPISMPSTPTKYNQNPVCNDSDLRESNFLRRMQQSPFKENECLSSNEFTIIPISVKTTVKPISSVKVKLESASKPDNNFLKRVNNRRAMKFQRQQLYNENVQFFKAEHQIEDDLFKPICKQYYVHCHNPSCLAVPPIMPTHISNTEAPDSDLDQKFKFALKNMLPVPSNSEQRIILDEYNQQLSQFSIAINRIIRAEKSDENCVHLLKLLAGMYTLLKTTLLNPPIYNELFQSVVSIESDAHNFIVTWSQTASYDKQVELFELGWFCDSALPRAYLVTVLYFSLESLWRDPEYLTDTFSACKSIQHPLKGSFLYSRLHAFLKNIYKREGEMGALIIGYSVETFTTLLRLFCRWHQSLPAKTTEVSFIASLYKESFEKFFHELADMCSYDMFEAVVLPTILTEVVNSGDLLAQTLIFTSLVQEFDEEYLLAQLDQLIKSTSQFAQGIDLKTLLNHLFIKVQRVNGGNGGKLFETIWRETSKLIKNRCEIDQSDTVIISSLILSLISKCTDDKETILNFIETVLEFLIKTLKTLRPEGFNSETTSVGAEIVSLIKTLMDDFDDFEGILLKIEGLPELINCLTPKSSRKCCLNQILPKLKTLTEENVKSVMRLFGCLSKTDLVQLSSDSFDIEVLKDITMDLKDFSNVLISLLSNEMMIRKFYEAIDSSSSCLNLFLLPKILELTSFNESFYKLLSSSMLQNTSTVLPQRLEETSKELEWIEPEFTKLMAVKMNLNVIEKICENNSDPYEFYSEILNILNNNVSQDYLKIQIIENVLDTFQRTRKFLNYDDFKCLLDHLSKESCQLLRKSDRCTLLLKIITINEHCTDTADTDTYNRYIDQLIGLLSSLQEDEIKFELSCKVMEIIMKRRRIKSGNEENIYQWMKTFIERRPEKEIQFYTIKLKYDERGGYIDKSESIIADTNPANDTNDNDTNDDHDNNDSYNTQSTHNTLDDLQKLKIFESFQM